MRVPLVILPLLYLLHTSVAAPVCTSENVGKYYPDYSKNSGYFKCLYEGVAIPMNCPPGRYFDAYQQACVPLFIWRPPPGTGGLIPETSKNPDIGGNQTPSPTRPPPITLPTAPTVPGQLPTAQTPGSGSGSGPGIPTAGGPDHGTNAGGEAGPGGPSTPVPTPSFTLTPTPPTTLGQAISGPGTPVPTPAAAEKAPDGAPVGPETIPINTEPPKPPGAKKNGPKTKVTKRKRPIPTVASALSKRKTTAGAKEKKNRKKTASAKKQIRKN